MDRMNAVIIAGTDGTSCVPGIANKALIPLCDRPMIEYVIDAVRACKYIERVALISTQDVFDAVGGRVDVTVPQGESLMANIGLCGQVFPEEDRIFVITGDVPLVTGAMLDDLIEQCGDPAVDFYYPILRMEDTLRLYPEAHRTSLRIREGKFTGGNAYVVRVNSIAPALEKTRLFVENRKKPWRIARIVGPDMLLRLAVGNLPLANIESRFQQFMQVNAKAVIARHPAIGNDVDKAEDVRMAQAHLMA